MTGSNPRIERIKYDKKMWPACKRWPRRVSTLDTVLNDAGTVGYIVLQVRGQMFYGGRIPPPRTFSSMAST
jgi:hypothetical protein